MRNATYIVISFLALAVMEGVSLLAFKVSKNTSSSDTQTTESPAAQESRLTAKTEPKPEESKKPLGLPPYPPTTDPLLGIGNASPGNFPPPTTEVVNGKTERTIHMGVRQYVWEPKQLIVKKGELVRLVIHNADVKHGLVIPDLGVNQDIPPEGAVVEFTPEKRGTFEFFCSVWCGEGHMEMQGSITVE